MSALEVVAELEPGVALARPATGAPSWVITKAGSFGDDEVLTRTVMRLRALGAIGV